MTINNKKDPKEHTKNRSNLILLFLTLKFSIIYSLVYRKKLTTLNQILAVSQFRGFLKSQLKMIYILGGEIFGLFINKIKKYNYV